MIKAHGSAASVEKKLQFLALGKVFATEDSKFSCHEELKKGNILFFFPPAIYLIVSKYQRVCFSLLLLFSFVFHRFLLVSPELKDVSILHENDVNI